MINNSWFEWFNSYETKQKLYADCLIFKNEITYFISATTFFLFKIPFTWSNAHENTPKHEKPINIPKFPPIELIKLLKLISNSSVTTLTSVVEYMKNIPTYSVPFGLSTRDNDEDLS